MWKGEEGGGGGVAAKDVTLDSIHCVDYGIQLVINKSQQSVS